jgi:hypothetical protein
MHNAIQRTALYTLTLVSLASISSQAMALVTVDLFAGQRTSTLKLSDSANADSFDLTTTEAGATFRVEPFKSFPLGFGLQVSSYSGSEGEAVGTILSDAFESEPDTAGIYTISASTEHSGMSYGPNFIIWLPTPLIQPYLNVSYMIGSSTESTTVDGETKSGYSPEATISGDIEQVNTTSSTDIAVGIRYRKNPIFGLFAEYCLSRGTYTQKSSAGSLSFESGGASTSVPFPNVSGSGRNDANIVRVGLQTGF